MELVAQRSSESGRLACSCKKGSRELVPGVRLGLPPGRVLQPHFCIAMCFSHNLRGKPGSFKAGFNLKASLPWQQIERETNSMVGPTLLPGHGHGQVPLPCLAVTQHGFGLPVRGPPALGRRSRVFVGQHLRLGFSGAPWFKPCGGWWRNPFAPRNETVVATRTFVGTGESSDTRIYWVVHPTVHPQCLVPSSLRNLLASLEEPELAQTRSVQTLPLRLVAPSGR